MRKQWKRRAWNALLILLALLTAAAVFLFIWELTRERRPPNPLDSQIDLLLPRTIEPEEKDPPVYQEIPWEVLENLPEEEKPVVYITPTRAEYESGTMRLVVPALSLDFFVQDGTDAQTLNQGPGLFEYARLPGESDANVSIAGHRIVSPTGFYYLHRLQAGDVFYLVYDGFVYRYAYETTEIVAPDAWEVIGGQGKPCLTLLSCEPARAATHRLIVRAVWEETMPYTEDFAFSAKTE